MAVEKKVRVLNGHEHVRKYCTQRIDWMFRERVRL